MRKKISCLSVVLFFLFTQNSVAAPPLLENSTGAKLKDTVPLAQPPANSKYIGVVLSTEDNTPLAAVTISSALTQKNLAATDDDGRFSVAAGEGDSLVFESSGYERHAVLLGKKKFLRILMKVNTAELADVVVVGYQARSRKTSASAISSISGDEIRDFPSVSLDVMLQGKVPGMNVQNFTGEPGVRNSVVIRGSTGLSTEFGENSSLTSPLYVVDGIPLEIDNGGEDITGTFALAGINVEDIKSIDVLKDASATAVYGSRAANGVIMITTLKGSLNQAPKINFRVVRGYTERPAGQRILGGAAERNERIQRYKDWMGTFGEGTLDAWLPLYVSDSLNPIYNASTNWQDLMMRAGAVQNINATVSGGASKLRYRMGVGYFDEKGIQVGTGLKRLNFTGNFDMVFSPIFTTNLIVKYVNTNRERPFYRLGTYIPSSLLYVSEDDKKVFTGAYEGYKDENVDHVFSIAVNNTIKIASFLSFRNQSAMNLSVARRDLFQPSAVTKRDNVSGLSETSLNRSYNINNFLDFRKVFAKKANVSLLVGSELSMRESRNTKLRASALPSDNISIISGVSPFNLRGTTGYYKDNIAGFFSQFNFVYNRRYTLAATLRSDGSSRFGNDNQFKYFPTFALAWVASEEKFLAKSDLISFLKIRGSFGITGDRPPLTALPNSTYIVNAAYAYSDNGNGNIVSTYNGDPSITPQFEFGLPQSDLSWERTMNYNLGIDLSLFKNRLKIDFNAYQRNTSGIFLKQRLHSYSGYSYSYTNAAAMRNRGLELGINTQNIRTKNFQWNTNLVFSRNRGIITRLPFGEDYIFYDPSASYASQINRLSVGFPRYVHMLMQYLGTYSSYDDLLVNPFTGELAKFMSERLGPGDPKYADLDGNYQFSRLAYGDFYLGSGIDPDITGGIYNQFSYKNISLAIQCNYTLGRKALNVSFADKIRALKGKSGSAVPDLSDIDYYIPASPGNPGNTDALYPGLNPVSGQNTSIIRQADIFLEDASYFKVRNINLSYRLNANFLKKLGISSCRFYGVLDNVLILKKSKNMADPEAVNGRGWYTGSLYPIAKRYTLGIDISL